MLTRLSIFSALILTSSVAEAAPPAPPIELAILADGSIQVDGQRYSTRPAIDAEIARLGKRNVRANLRIKVDRHATYDEVAYILAQMQRTGTLKIGIVNTQPQEH